MSVPRSPFALAAGDALLLVSGLRGITGQHAGRRHNRRVANTWRRTHLLAALSDKAEVAGIQIVRRAGTVPARRDRRRHLMDQRRSCPAPGRPPRGGSRSPAPGSRQRARARPHGPPARISQHRKRWLKGH
jgi:hypothetical protein